MLRQVFRGDEFTDYVEAFRQEWLSDIPNLFGEFGRYSSDNEISLYEDFKDNLREAQSYFELESDEDFDRLYASIDSHIEALEAEQPAPSYSDWTPSVMEPSNQEGSNSTDSIFEDVDA